MRTRKTRGLLAFIMMMTLLVTACSSKGAMDVDTSTANDRDVKNSHTELMQSTGSSGATTNQDYDESFEIPGASYSLTSGADQVQPQDKIIRTFYLDIETKEFDSLITTIDARIKELGGYVESSNITGEPYNYSNTTRRGSIVARIPSERVDEFINTMGDNANIITRNENTENVSLEYIDAESRVETLKIEQERLFAILEKEVNLDNIITLESRLSEIRYELQNYESKLRYYDNQVAYSTVNMDITEVEKLTPVTETKPTMGTRIQNGFKRTMNDIGEGLQDFCVWFIVNLPYLLIWGLIITVIVIIIRKAIKKSNAKKTSPSPMVYNGPQYNASNQPGLNMLNPDQNQQNKNDQNQQK